MAISLVSVGQKITAYIQNLIIAAVNAQGYTTVVPTSVSGSGVSVSTAGKVTFSAASSVSINGLTGYDTYELEMVYTTSAAAQVTLRLRGSGSDSSASVYDRQRLSGISLTASAGQTLAASSWAIGESIICRERIRLTFVNLTAAAATHGEGVVASTANPMASTSGVSVLSLLHRSTTAYDGFTLAIASGSITGYARVRGINTQA